MRSNPGWILLSLAVSGLVFFASGCAAPPTEAVAGSTSASDITKTATQAQSTGNIPSSADSASSSSASPGDPQCKETAMPPSRPALSFVFSTPPESLDRSTVSTSSQALVALTKNGAPFDALLASGKPITCSLVEVAQVDAGGLTVETTDGVVQTNRVDGPSKLVWVVAIEHVFIPSAGPTRISVSEGGLQGDSNEVMEYMVDASTATYWKAFSFDETK